MNTTRPGRLAVRAVNQYRRRDVLTYLALRYYLDNSAACNDQWIKQIATNLVLTRTTSPYFHSPHFKEKILDENIEHRSIYLPCANEALAEAALMDECSKYSEFLNPSCVYSYDLVLESNDRSGIFIPYFNGLKKRQEAIAHACDSYPGGIVKYVDIKKFYPSIKTDIGLKAWKNYSHKASLPKVFQLLGDKLIEEHSKISIQDGNGILTGPMFSHLIGNLVLRELDEKCLKSIPAKYFRYVDDITLVGNEVDVNYSYKLIKTWLSEIHLEPHDESSPKTITTSTIEWNKGRHDFKSSYEESWGSLIFDLNQYLLLNYKDTSQLKNAFLENSIRIPIRDYTDAIFESSYLVKVKRWLGNPFYCFKRNPAQISIDSLVKKSQFLCNVYKNQFEKIAEECKSADPYHRKRFISKLRYCSSRLIFLASDEVLSNLSSRAGEFPELVFHSEVLNAVASGNIDRILSFGTNVAQAAAQPLRAANKQVQLKSKQLSDVEKKALSIFLLNGVNIKNISDLQQTQSEHDLLKFSIQGSNLNLMKDSEPFIRELSCLHGITEKPRHPELLEKLFDKDETLIMDVIDNLQYS